MNRKNKIKVCLLKQTKQLNLPSKKQFQQWIENALIKPVEANEITVCIVDPTKMAELNQQFRHKKGPTNVLAFETIPIPGEESHSLGDIVICAELVEKEATLAKKKVLSHWAHLTVHGTLHLLGYDHQKTKQTQIMEGIESQILHELGFPDPYLSGKNYVIKKS